MKNILFTLSLLLVVGMANAQLKVFSDGDTKIGNTGTAPINGAKLDVDGRIAISYSAGTRFIVGSDDNQSFVLGNNTTVTGSRAYLQMNGGNASPGNEGNFTFGGTRLWFRTNVTTAGTGTAVGKWESSGNLGINNFAPAERLHVNGNIQITGGSLISSDKRLKTDIQPFTEGLNTILQINPVTYKFNGKGGTDTERTHVGIIAQDIEKVAPYMVDSYVHRDLVSGDDVTNPELGKEEEYLRVSAGDIQYLLVNAIKEQQDLIDDLQTQINELKTLLEQGSGDQSVILQGNGDAFLGQNSPNPYSDYTSINYELPESAQGGKMQFFDMMGKLIKTVDLTDKVGIVEVSTQDLPSGTYTYSLLVDNARVATKRMVYNK